VATILTEHIGYIDNEDHGARCNKLNRMTRKKKTGNYIYVSEILRIKMVVKLYQKIYERN